LYPSLMSISPALRASARAAYRDLLRASSVTFSGDAVVQNAFKLKMRTEIVPNTATADGKAFEAKVALTREITDVLRKNVAQARKVQQDGEDRWRLNITSHTELGSNDTIKNPPPVESSRSARKRKPSPCSCS